VTDPRPDAGGDADIAAVAALFADRTRARVLLALDDGRALPASVLAGEAGVSRQAASAALRRLTESGLITGERSGRFRYYRLASPRVAAILEALAATATAEPVRSLRQHTRAAALRRARTCYDHLAGRFGCDLTQALLDRHVLATTDGIASTSRRAHEPLAAQLREHPYELGDRASAVLADLGVHPEVRGSGRRPLLRFCVDWSEQRHHLAGGLGAAVLTGLERARWIARRPHDRAVTVTDLGWEQLGDRLGLSRAASAGPAVRTASSRRR
jgi:DNA-binding transcriptional ArsR family regulator